MKRHLWVVSRSLPVHFRGGMERVAFDVCAGLARRGWAIDLATTRLDRDPGLPEGVRVHGLDAPPGVYSARFRRELAAWAARRAAPDLLLSISFAAGPVKVARREIPLICQMHGSAWRDAARKLPRMDPRGLYRLWLHLAEERRTLAACDRIVAVGPAVRGYLGSFPYGFLKQDRIVTIPNGIDLKTCSRAAALDRAEIRRSLGVPPGDRLIVTACRLVPEKGVYELLRAYELMEGRDHTSLVIAGSGRDEKRIRHASEKRGLARVRMAGELPREQVLAAMGAADLVVQISTLPEGLPLVILEALVVGCPVLVSERTTLPDFEGSDRSVIRVDPLDRLAIARALDRGLRAGGTDEGIAAGARRSFSLEMTIDRYEALIEEVVRERAPQ